MNRKLITSLLSLALFVTTFFPASVQAKINQETIIFKAATVNPPCSYNFNKRETKLNCFDSKTNKMHPVKIKNNKEINTVEWNGLKNNTENCQLDAVNEEKGLDIVSVYHY